MSKSWQEWYDHLEEEDIHPSQMSEEDLEEFEDFVDSWVL